MGLAAEEVAEAGLAVLHLARLVELALVGGEVALAALGAEGDAAGEKADGEAGRSELGGIPPGDRASGSRSGLATTATWSPWKRFCRSRREGVFSSGRGGNRR